MKEGSSLLPLRQVRSSTEQLQQSIYWKAGLHLRPLKIIKKWRVIWGTIRQKSDWREFGEKVKGVRRSKEGSA